jgi:ABC-type transport system involved in multi-copper enzyme maturation permease subunit
MRRIIAMAQIVWIEMIRKKDVYVLFILLAALLLAMASMNLFGLGQVSGYIKDMGLFSAWLLGWVLTINLSVRLLPMEHSRGTIYSLLAKPVSRAEILAGKWLGAWSVVTAALLTFYLTTWAAVLFRGGAFDPISLAQAFLLHAVALAMVAALGVAFSTRLNSDAAATLTYVLTGTTFILLPRIPALLVAEQGFRGTALLALYYALPHFELFDLRQRLVHDWGPASWTIVTSIVLYGALMTGIFLLLAWIGYRRRRFSRGDLL